MIEKLKDRKFIVFCVEHYNPLGIIRSLGEKGIYPIVIILNDNVKIASKSRYIFKLHSVDTIEEGYEILQTYLENESRYPFVYTADDKITCFLDRHFDELKGKCYFFNANSKGKITHYINKDNILNCAKRHGLKVLDAVIVKKGDIPENLSYPIITKAVDPTVGGWKNDMFICNSREELESAYEKIKSPIIMLQKYIKKANEYCMEGFSINHGKQMVITIASTYNYLLEKTYSPYMTVQNFEKFEIKQALDKMFEEIGFEGIFEIEFLVDSDENLYFGEINFRNSTWSYASTCAGMNLPYLWAISMIDNEIADDYYKEIPTNFTAMVELTDFKERVLNGKVNVLLWLYEFLRSNCKYYIGKKDFGAFLGMIYSRIVK